MLPAAAARQTVGRDLSLGTQEQQRRIHALCLYVARPHRRPSDFAAGRGGGEVERARGWRAAPPWRIAAAQPAAPPHTMACWLIPIAKFRRNLKNSFFKRIPTHLS
eukprot:COSAG01_NODE_4274_length_5190_cov_1.718916_1_plen_106_part_00